MRTCSWLFVALFVLGCGGKKEAGTGTGSGSAPVAPVAAVADAAAAPGGVEVFVDDKPVATVTQQQLASWPRLDALVPEDARRLGTWTVVKLVGANTTELPKPSANHPDKVPALFPGEGGAPAFGMFDPVELAKRGQPAAREDQLREVRISLSKQERGGDHQGSTGEEVDPLKLVVTIKTAAGDKKLTGAQILALPREPQPGNEETKGWRVTQFLTAVGVTKYQSLILIDAGGTSIPLEKRDLDPDKANPFIKLNKQGALRFRMFTKQGDGWQPGADLRALVAIEVK